MKATVRIPFIFLFSRQTQFPPHLFIHLCMFQLCNCASSGSWTFSSFQSLSSTKKHRLGQTIQMTESRIFRLFTRAKEWEIIPSFDLLAAVFLWQPLLFRRLQVEGLYLHRPGMGQILFTVQGGINLEWIHLAPGLDTRDDTSSYGCQRSVGIFFICGNSAGNLCQL